MLRPSRIVPSIAIPAGTLGTLHAQHGPRRPFALDSLRAAIRYLPGDDRPMARSGCMGAATWGDIPAMHPHAMPASS